MRNAAQRSLNPAENNRHIGIRLLATLRIDNRGTIRTFTTQSARRIRIIRTRLTVSGITINHRIHIARRHTEKQIRLTQRHKRLFRLPIGLRNNANAKPLRLQHPPNHRHPKRWMIHIRIARNNNNVAAIPTELIHLRTRHGQIIRRAITLRPIFGVIKQRCCNVWVCGSRHGVYTKLRKKIGYCSAVCPICVMISVQTLVNTCSQPFFYISE